MRGSTHMVGSIIAVMSEQEPAHTPIEKIVRSAMRAVGAVVALTTIYFLLPLHNASMGVVATILTIGLVILIGLLIFQVRSVMSSPARSRPATVAHHLTDDRRASTVR